MEEILDEIRKKTIKENKATFSLKKSQIEEAILNDPSLDLERRRQSLKDKVKQIKGGPQTEYIREFRNCVRYIVGSAIIEYRKREKELAEQKKEYEQIRIFTDLKPVIPNFFPAKEARQWSSTQTMETLAQIGSSDIIPITYKVYGKGEEDPLTRKFLKDLFFMQFLNTFENCPTLKYYGFDWLMETGEQRKIAVQSKTRNIPMDCSLSIRMEHIDPKSAILLKHFEIKNEYQFMDIYYQLFHNLYFLHSIGILYGDLDWNNIIGIRNSKFRSGYEWKLINFHQSTFIGLNPHKCALPNPGNEIDTYSFDMYYFGILLIGILLKMAGIPKENAFNIKVSEEEEGERGNDIKFDMYDLQTRRTMTDISLSAFLKSRGIIPKIITANFLQIPYNCLEPNPIKRVCAKALKQFHYREGFPIPKRKYSNKIKDERWIDIIEPFQDTGHKRGRKPRITTDRPTVEYNMSKWHRDSTISCEIEYANELHNLYKNDYQPMPYNPYSQIMRTSCKAKDMWGLYYDIFVSLILEIWDWNNQNQFIHNDETKSFAEVTNFDAILNALFSFLELDYDLTVSNRAEFFFFNLVPLIYAYETILCGNERGNLNLINTFKAFGYDYQDGNEQELRKLCIEKMVKLPSKYSFQPIMIHIAKLAKEENPSLETELGLTPERREMYWHHVLVLTFFWLSRPQQLVNDPPTNYEIIEFISKKIVWWRFEQGLGKEISVDFSNNDKMLRFFCDRIDDYLKYYQTIQDVLKLSTSSFKYGNLLKAGVSYQYKLGEICNAYRAVKQYLPLLSEEEMEELFEIQREKEVRDVTPAEVIEGYEEQRKQELLQQLEELKQKQEQIEKELFGSRSEPPAAPQILTESSSSSTQLPPPTLQQQRMLEIMGEEEEEEEEERGDPKRQRLGASFILARL